MTESQYELKKRHPEFSEDEKAPFQNSWVYGYALQMDILNWFKSNIEGGSSIAVMYCKDINPVDEDSRRLIVGIGEIVKVHNIKTYDSTADYTYPFWDIIMEHSIRPDLSNSNGFILPYNEYLSIPEETIIAKAGISKAEALNEIKISWENLGCSQTMLKELSYGCEYISDQNILIILTKARKCIENIKKHKLVGKELAWDKQLRWIDSQIKKVKQMMGPFPSFAEALRSIGVDYAYLIEQDLRANGFCGVKDNPWESFEKLISGDIKIDNAVYNIEIKDYHKTWGYLSIDQKETLKLLSRFTGIDSEMIEHWISSVTNMENVKNNPYIICEGGTDIECIYDTGITPAMIDLGIMKDVDIQGEWVPEKPSLVSTPLDIRRLRAFTICKLREQLDLGDTLLSISEVEDYLKSILENEKVRLLLGTIRGNNRDFMAERLQYLDEKAIQLKEYYVIEQFLRKCFEQRAKKCVKNSVSENWDSLVEGIDGYDPSNERSKSAAQDQIRALKMFSNKRLSVLTGAAGTGKTTIVKAFLNSEQIKRDGVLLLAPTGKARVRLASMSETRNAQTIAQFLCSRGLYDFKTMRNIVPGANYQKYNEAATVIIDECSMITSFDFYVLLKSLDLVAVKRIILIGDPNQLPPIGAGKPFSDLCNYLSSSDDESLKGAITQLNTIVRTIKSGESDVQMLASWFSGKILQKDADMVFDKIIDNKLNSDLSVYYWTDENDIKEQLNEVLEKELTYSGKTLDDRIKCTLGLDNINNAVKHPELVERMQVLSPVKNPLWGTYQINLYFQEWLRQNKNSFKTSIHPNNYYYGDKIIQLKNDSKPSYPGNNKVQLSNGQIGFVKYADKDTAQVVFSGLPNMTFYYNPMHSEENNSQIDLAYAITVHKSQGSDFDTVIVVLPKSGKILSRELIYTALTRAKVKLILLIQDDISWLRGYTQPQTSVLALRNSNMFTFTVREERNSIPFAEGLIHRAKKKGLIVRSKSELIIADHLYNEGIEFEYEKLLEEGGHRFIPDFSFEDASGDRIIWEHLGMLDVPAYRQAWEKKKELYKEIGFIEGENLFVTQDHENGSFYSQDVINVIEKIKELI